MSEKKRRRSHAEKRKFGAFNRALQDFVAAANRRDPCPRCNKTRMRTTVSFGDEPPIEIPVSYCKCHDEENPEHLARVEVDELSTARSGRPDMSESERKNG